MEITTGIYGYSVGDKFITITKFKYRLPLASNKIYFVHYLLVDPTKNPIPIGPPIPTVKPIVNNLHESVSNLPRHPMDANRVDGNSMMNQVPHFNRAPRPVLMSSAQPNISRPPQMAARNIPPSTPTAVQQQSQSEEVADIIIDDIDKFNLQEFAASRFKFNYQNMEKIFTPLKLKTEKDFMDQIERDKKQQEELLKLQVL